MCEINFWMAEFGVALNHHQGLITLTLAYSKVQSPSWEANWFAASQEIPRISRNPKVHYRTNSVRHLSLSWASPIQSIYPHPTSWRSVLIHNYRVNYLLTYSMVQSPSWEANWFAASQEIPRISRNPKVHYRTHNRPPPVFILGQPIPVHIPTSHLLEIHPNVIHPSTPGSYYTRARKSLYHSYNSISLYSVS